MKTIYLAGGLLLGRGRVFLPGFSAFFGGYRGICQRPHENL